MATKSKTAKVRSNANGVKTSATKATATKNSSTSKANTPFKETVKAGSKTTSEGVDAWNKAIQAKIDDATARGKNVSYDYDDNGALHYTTYGKDRLQSILNDYNTNSTETSSPTYNTNGLTYTIKSKAQSNAEAQAAADAQAQAEQEAANAYTAQIQNNWDNALDAADNAYDINANQLNNIYNQSVTQANQNADDAARQQYILYKQGKNKLGEQLSSQGITGGASETALNSLLNSYSGNLATNEAARQSSLTDAANEYQNDLASLQAQLQNDKASINSSYGNALAEAQENYEADKAADEAAALEAYQSSLNQASIDKWNASVQKKINEVNPKYIWTDDEGKLHWSNVESTANIAKSKGYKVTTRTDAKTTSSSSTSKKKITSSSSNDTSSSGTKKVVSDDDPFGTSTAKSDTEVAKSIPTAIRQTAAAMRYGNSTYGQLTASKGIEQALAYIKKQYQSKKITEEQANYLIKMYATK